MLERLFTTPSWGAIIFAVLILYLVMLNLHKLLEFFGKKRRWETEQARIEANLRHWELQTYKKQHAHTGDDPFPVTDAPQLAGADKGRGELKSFLCRAGVGTVGAFATLVVFFGLLVAAGGELTSSFWQSASGLLTFALFAGMVTALRKDIGNAPSSILVGGVKTLFSVFLALFALVYLIFLVMSTVSLI